MSSSASPDGHTARFPPPVSMWSRWKQHRDAIELLLSETFVADDLGAPQHAPVADLLAGTFAASILTTPISAGSTRGILVMVRSDTLRSWTEADAQLVRGIAKVYGRALDVARAEELLTLTYSQGPVGFAIRHWNGTLVDCNQQYLDTWGLTREQVDRIDLSELVDPDDWTCFQGQVARLRRGETDRVHREVRATEVPNGPKWFRLTPSNCRPATRPTRCC